MSDLFVLGALQLFQLTSFSVELQHVLQAHYFASELGWLDSGMQSVYA